MPITFKYFQKLIYERYYDRDSARGLHATFTWLVEEVGELANAILKMDLNNASEEIADVIAWTFSIANLLGIDVEEAVRRKYNIKGDQA